MIKCFHAFEKSLLRFRGLADMNGDGRMDFNEFSIACKLINLKLKGMELPKSLPPQVSPLFYTSPFLNWSALFLYLCWRDDIAQKWFPQVCPLLSAEGDGIAQVPSSTCQSSLEHAEVDGIVPGLFLSLLILFFYVLKGMELSQSFPQLVSSLFLCWRDVCRWFRFAQLAKGKKSRP
jgi:hypothetical protein